MLILSAVIAMLNRDITEKELATKRPFTNSYGPSSSAYTYRTPAATASWNGQPSSASTSAAMPTSSSSYVPATSVATAAALYQPSASPIRSSLHQTHTSSSPTSATGTGRPTDVSWYRRTTPSPAASTSYGSSRLVPSRSASMAWMEKSAKASSTTKEMPSFSAYFDGHTTGETSSPTRAPASTSDTM